MANFAGASFQSGASFQDAKFEDSAWFQGATFEGEPRFDGATFNHNADFSGATFARGPRFAEVTFKRRARFEAFVDDQQRVFLPEQGGGHSDVAAPSSKPFVEISFEGALFAGVAVFRGRRFEGAADFSGAVFRVVPDFAGCEGLSHLDLSNVTISFGDDVRWRRNWTTSGEVETRLRRIAKDVEAGDLERFHIRRG